MKQRKTDRGGREKDIKRDRGERDIKRDRGV